MGYISILSSQGVFTTRTEYLSIRVSEGIKGGKAKVTIRGWYEGWGKRVVFDFPNRELANAFAKSVSDQIPQTMTAFHHHTIDVRKVR